MRRHAVNVQVPSPLFFHETLWSRVAELKPYQVGLQKGGENRSRVSDKQSRSLKMGIK